jgi:regulator of protease activity HflC (stomatin/prohibitin superfamily)
MTMPYRVSTLCAAASLLFTLATGCAYVDVPPGHVAVDWTPAGMSKQIYREGEWPIGTYDQATVFDTRSQEREERLNVLAANGLRIVFDTSVRFHIIADEVLQLDQELGPKYYDILLGPILRSQARRVAGRYQPEEIYSTQREAIEREMREGVEGAIKGRHIVLEAVLIRDVALPNEIQQAINDKLQAEQQSLKQKYVIETAKQVAERQRIEAEAEAQQTRARAQGSADAHRILAQGDADAQRISAKATADYQNMVSKNITPSLLDWQKIQATSDLSRSPNSKVVVLGGSKTTSLLEVKEQ